MKKSSHLDRRTLLRGAAASLALPWLECMATAKEKKTAAELPRRLCCVYFPFGVSLPPANHEHAQWNWFPTGTADKFQFTKTLESLEPLRKHVTVMGGLSHPNGRKMGGHDTGDIFLTAASFKGSNFVNSISLDQVVASQVGVHTRYSSLTMSSDGGVGEPTRATTLSFSREGRPIPALASPRQIFDRMFGKDDSSAQSAKQQLERTGSMLDLLRDHSNSLKRRLGKLDQHKFEEYLDSVRSIEKKVERSQQWLNVAKPHVDPTSVALEASPEGPLEYIRAMYDLIYLAFQTDSTRVATYMLGQVAGATTVANTFPACIGLNGNWHGLAHGAGKKGGFERLGRFDQFLAEQLAYFLTRLQDTQEADGTLLDRTLVLYGSSNSRTHQNQNYPLVLAGGNRLGLRHGQYLTFKSDTPMSNLFVSMLNALDMPATSFVDSTGRIDQLHA